MAMRETYSMLGAMFLDVWPGCFLWGQCVLCIPPHAHKDKKQPNQTTESLNLKEKKELRDQLSL
jgi:hypothetical protein